MNSECKSWWWDRMLSAIPPVYFNCGGQPLICRKFNDLDYVNCLIAKDKYLKNSFVSGFVR